MEAFSTSGNLCSCKKGHNHGGLFFILLYLILPDKIQGYRGEPEMNAEIVTTVQALRQ